MAIAFVQSKTGTGAGTGNAITASGTYTAGNFIAVCVVKRNVSSTITMSNTATALTWQQAKVQTGNTVSVDIWYAENIIGQTCTIKALSNSGTDEVSIVAQEFSGLATSSSIDKTAGGTGTDASPTSGATATTTTASQLVFGALGSDDGTPTDAVLGSGYTNLARATNAGNFTFAAAESKVIAATGAQTATFGMGGFSSNWDCAVATFKAAGSNLFSQSLTGSLSFIGAQAKSTRRLLTGVLSFVGSVLKRTAKASSAALSFVGAMSTLKAFGKSMTATLSFVGSQTKLTSHFMTARLSFIGAVLKAVAYPLASAGLSFIGVIGKGMTLTKATFFAILPFGNRVWYAGSHSVDISGNSNWDFTA